MLGENLFSGGHTIGDTHNSKVLITTRSGWSVLYEVTDDTWLETAEPISISFTLRVEQPWMNSQALVRLCLTEVPIVVLLEETNGYKVIQPGQQIVKGTYSLFVDELTVNQESYLKLTIVNEIIVKGSMGTGLRYGIM